MPLIFHIYIFPRLRRNWHAELAPWNSDKESSLLIFISNSQTHWVMERSIPISEIWITFLASYYNSTVPSYVEPSCLQMMNSVHALQIHSPFFWRILAGYSGSCLHNYYKQIRYFPNNWFCIACSISEHHNRMLSMDRNTDSQISHISCQLACRRGVYPGSGSRRI